MKRYAEDLIYLGAGPLAAILLGISLIPLRDVTPASNLSFAFMAVTIVVAEFGGRWAAVATALVSALSLDFFLTRPYVTLAMEDKHDVVAFVGLGVCGLIAAALASGRSRRLATQTTALAHRDLLRSILQKWDATAPVETQLAKTLQDCLEVFPLAAAIVRDDRDRVLASTEPADRLRAVPRIVLEPNLLMTDEHSGQDPRPWSLELPQEGGRIPLAHRGRLLAWLDVWGSGEVAIMESRRALSDVGRLIAVLLANGASGQSSQNPVPTLEPAP